VAPPYARGAVLGLEGHLRGHRSGYRRCHVALARFRLAMDARLGRDSCGCACLWPSQVGVAMTITHAQTVNNHTDGTASSIDMVMATMGMDNLVRVRVASFAGDLLASKITDTQSNTYVKVGSVEVPGGSTQWECEFWSFVSASANTITVTTATGGNDYLTACVSEYNSTTGWPANPLHTSSSVQRTAVTNPTSSIATTIVADCIVGAHITDFDSNNSYTSPGGAWVNRSADNGTSDHNALYAEDQIVTATGSYEVAWAVPATTDFGILIAAYHAIPEALVDTELVVRYYLDEAASGTGPTSIVDASGNAYDLDTVNYGSGNMAFTESVAGRGLKSTAIAGTQRAVHAINDTSDAVRDAMVGVQKCTIEIVCSLIGGNNSGGRIFGINDRVGENGRFMLKGVVTSAQGAVLSFNDDDSFFTGITLSATRTVWHFVVDTTQATLADRCKVYRDGVLDSVTVSSIAQNTTLSIGSGHDLIMFNRENSSAFERSVDATLYYAAMYSGALTAGEALTNALLLFVDDDEPAAPAVAGTNGNVVNAFGPVPALGGGPVPYIFYPA